MRSRLLPWSRTLDFAQPPGVQRAEHEGFVVYGAPGCRGAASLHRLLLDEPPAGLAEARGLWRSLHGDDVAKGLVAWEGRKHLDTGAEPTARVWCSMCDQELLPVDGVAVRRLTLDDLDAVVALLAGPDDACRFIARGQLGRDDGAFFGTESDEGLTALAGIVWNQREARLQLVRTRPEARRRGLATALVRQAVFHYQQLSFGITYASAEEGSAAEALFASLEFRRTTAVQLVTAP